MRTQFLKSITKGLRLDFPTFDGTNHVGWIRQSEKFFQMAGTPTKYKVNLAQMHIVGKADVWLIRSNNLKKKPSWDQLCTDLLQRFSASSSYDLTDRFNSLKQNTATVSEYTEQFEEIMADVQENNPHISESWFVRCYVNGFPFLAQIPAETIETSNFNGRILVSN